jgi:RNA polymerase sigma-70 factor (ECF subfamily)
VTVSRIENPSDERWQAVYRAERAALLGFLRRQVRDESLAEDLVQETFVRAIRAGRAGEEPARLRSYLFTIAQNLAVDHWRRRPRALPLVEETGDPDAGAPELEDRDAESPEAATRRRALLRRVGAALGRLPDRYRTAFQLAAIEQRSYREIGEATGWSLDQVRVNVHRARRRLIEELGDALA